MPEQAVGPRLRKERGGRRRDRTPSVMRLSLESAGSFQTCISIHGSVPGI